MLVATYMFWRPTFILDSSPIIRSELYMQAYYCDHSQVSVEWLIFPLLQRDWAVKHVTRKRSVCADEQFVSIHITAKPTHRWRCSVSLHAIESCVLKSRFILTKPGSWGTSSKIQSRSLNPWKPTQRAFAWLLLTRSPAHEESISPHASTSPQPVSDRIELPIWHYHALAFGEQLLHRGSRSKPRWNNTAHLSTAFRTRNSVHEKTDRTWCEQAGFCNYFYAATFACHWVVSRHSTSSWDLNICSHLIFVSLLHIQCTLSWNIQGFWPPLSWLLLYRFMSWLMPGNTRVGDLLYTRGRIGALTLDGCGKLCAVICVGTIHW